MPADPGVGHDRRAGARLDRRRRLVAAAVRLRAVERVVAAELVAHLVRDVVDGEEVADRRREAGAAARLAVSADGVELGDAAARVAEREVADVVVRGADELADHDLVAGERGARAGRVACAAVKHGAEPHGPFGPVAWAASC